MPDWPHIVGHIYAAVNKDRQCYFIHWILSEQWTGRLTNCPTLHKYLRLKILPQWLQRAYRVIPSPTLLSFLQLQVWFYLPNWFLHWSEQCHHKYFVYNGEKIRTRTKNSNLIFIRICKDAQYMLYACLCTIFCNLNILLLCCSLWLRSPTLLFHFIISDTSQQLFEVASCSTLQQDLCSSQDWYWVWFFVK